MLGTLLIIIYDWSQLQGENAATNVVARTVCYGKGNSCNKPRQLLPLPHLSCVSEAKTQSDKHYTSLSHSPPLSPPPLSSSSSSFSLSPSHSFCSFVLVGNLDGRLHLTAVLCLGGQPESQN